MVSFEELISYINNYLDPINANVTSLDGTRDGQTIIYGCTDSAAYNYDVLANTDDGSCVFASQSPNTIVDGSQAQKIVEYSCYDTDGSGSGLLMAILAYDNLTLQEINDIAVAETGSPCFVFLTSVVPESEANYIFGCMDAALRLMILLIILKI